MSKRILMGLAALRCIHALLLQNARAEDLDKAWDEAIEKGWTVVDMKTDWKIIFPSAK
jgi:hypothetical protein